MTEELKEDMEKLKKELEELKEQLKEKVPERRKSGRGIYIDIGERVNDYIEDVMDGISEGIHGELEKSIFVGPHGQHIKIASARGGANARAHARVDKHDLFEEEDESADFDNTAKVMSALGQEQRLKILRELMSGGKYANELQEKLTDIAASTLSSHLNVLEEAGLVVQERVRGRYLITIPGRSAYKMARRVNRLIERRTKE
ncbi:MAG: winged helix-turn-helix transcriptional regulator [Candidatus Bathyarchaeota archaeon]|nr:MAG: winged helix-turn-helix transcriptional regulator [Candidatus Bathyarchaeota archaeon]